MGAVPAALCVVWVAYSLWSRSAGTDIPAQASRALAYLTAQAQVFATYARMLVLPAGLSVDHDFRPAPAASLYFVLCLMELAGFLAIAVVARRRLPLLSFLVLMFFILLAPTSSIVPSGDLLFEHRLYLPMIPFAIVAAWGILAAVRRLFASGRLRIAVSCLCGCLLLGALAEASRRRTYVWGDGVRLWSDAVAKAPRKARTHYNLAIAYLDRDRQAARRELLATLELEPRHAPALYNLGRIAQSEQSYDAAAGWYRRAIRADPGTWQAHHNLGNLETLKGNAGEAMREFEEAIRLRPDDWPAYLNLAGLQAQGRDFPAALRTLGILKNVRWDLPEARYLNAYILASQARYGEAESELRFIEEHDPQGNYRTRIRELRGRFPAGASR
jgi:Tfp pilus assembly protein PilF